VKVGCWGQVVRCNVPKRGWLNGVGGCPNVGGICIGCTMPGFPDKFMPFMDEPPGSKVSTAASGMYGSVIRSLRNVTAKTVDKEPKWRKTGRELTTGYRPNWEGGTALAAPERAGTGDRLVEMAWDPITRIVGSLGIYTKIDFAQKRVAECFSTSSIFRRYSILIVWTDTRHTP